MSEWEVFVNIGGVDLLLAIVFAACAIGLMILVHFEDKKVALNVAE